jgi:hypothetical protein
MRWTDPAHAAAPIARAHDSAPPHHGPARDVTARTNYRRSPNGTSTSHGGASASRTDLDYRAILLELLLERAVGSGKGRGWCSHHRKEGQNGDDGSGHAIENP